MKGLFFISTKNGIFIIKRSNNINSEILANKLFIEMGICSPKVYF